MVNGKSMRSKITVFDAFIYFIAVVFTAIVIFPFIHLIALSFNDGMDAMKGGIGFCLVNSHWKIIRLFCRKAVFFGRQ